VRAFLTTILASIRMRRFVVPMLCGVPLLLVTASTFGVAVGRRTPLRNAATAKKVVRVMTYNIHVGVGMDKKLDLARIAEIIKRERPDFVGLQEVDRGVARTKGVDQIAELSRLTNMEYAFAYNLRYQGGQYGVAVLSRHTILSLDHRRYANTRERERRGFLRIEANVNGHRFAFVTTHLDYQHEDGREFETKQLLDALKPDNVPLIVVGDFNAEPNDGAYRLMLTRFIDAWTLRTANAPDAGNTFPADAPAKRIDYVFYAKESGFRVRNIRVIETEASDHRPLIADLEF